MMCPELQKQARQQSIDWARERGDDVECFHVGPRGGKCRRKVRYWYTALSIVFPLCGKHAW